MEQPSLNQKCTHLIQHKCVEEVPNEIAIHLSDLSIMKG